MGSKNLPVGHETINQNGYRNVKVALPEGGTTWRLVHQVVAEEKILGRPLRSNERVEFIDASNRQNVHPSNLRVVEIKGATKTKRAAQIEVRIREYLAEYKELTGKDFDLNG